MKIHSLYLIAINIKKRAFSSSDKENNVTIFGTNGDPYLSQFFPDNMPGRTILIPSLKLTLTGFWAEKVRRAVVLKIKKNDFIVVITLFEITPETLNYLIDLRPDECTRLRDELISAAVDKKDALFLHRIPNILYAEPDEPIASESESIEEEVSKVISFLKYDTQEYLPHVLFDILFMPDIGLYKDFSEILAFRRSPLPEMPANFISIPKTVLDLALYISQIMQVKSLDDRLRALPLYDVNLAKYLKQFKAGSKIFRKYRENFLTTVERQLLELNLVKRQQEELLAPASQNLLSFFNASEVSFSVQINGRTYYDHDTLEIFVKQLNNANKWLTRTIKHLEDREALLSSCLSDIILASSIHINVSLQRSMYVLALIGVILAMVTISTEIIPEEAKRSFVAEFINIFYKHNGP